MSFLIAEILLLLALAAVLGGVLVWWFMRRHFVDVSSEYERYEGALAEVRALRQDKSAADERIGALEADKAQLDGRLADEMKWRKGVETKVETLSGAVGEIRPTDLAPVETRLEKIQGVVAKLQNTDVSAIASGVAATSAAVAAIKPTDLDPVAKKLQGIEAKVVATSAAVAAMKPTDLDPVAKKLDSIDMRVAAMKPADLDPVAKKLDSIDMRVAALRNTDISSVDTRVKALSESVRQLEARLKPQPPTDLSGVHTRLDGIEKALKDRPRLAPAPIAKKISAPRATAAPRKAAPKPRRKPAGALLKSASYGKADDLKQISGVGPKLEKMLQGIGVYYFFQVEAWTPRDVKRVDGLLKVFKGRIERDQWVKQARGLARQPGAARMR